MGVMMLPGFDAPSADSNEWYTPMDILDVAREALGGPFDLDPATCPEAQLHVRAERWYTTATDGLGQEWRARRMWLNPPYRNSGDWADKWAAAISSGRVEAGALLVPINGLSDEWGTRMRIVARLIGVVRGRVRFIRGSKNLRKGDPFLATVMVLAGSGLDLDRAARALARKCFVVEPKSFVWDTGYASWESRHHPGEGL